MKAIARVLIASSLAISFGLAATTARAESIRTPSGKVVPAQRATGDSDGTRMRPMPMPTVRGPMPGFIEQVIAASKARAPGAPMVFPGGEGSGDRPPGPPVRHGSAPQLAPGAAPDSAATSAPSRGASQGGGVGSQEYGASGQVFTMARPQNAASAAFRRAGTVTFSGGTCSGALIKRGLVVTAAHCIWDWYNGSAYGGWKFYPASKYGSTQYRGPDSDGAWPVYESLSVYITNDYLGGRAGCAGASSCDCNNAGVICTDDVALLALQPDSHGKYAGDYVGWYGYAINSYAYNSGQAQITQLGYPRSFDYGGLMERTDSRGFIDPSKFDNTIIGTSFNEGASGGPWLVNFGTPPVADAGVVQGSAPKANIIVGVTSWAYTCNCGPSSLRQNGASPFLANNIQQLVSYACGDHPGNC